VLSQQNIIMGHAKRAGKKFIVSSRRATNPWVEMETNKNIEKRRKIITKSHTSRTAHIHKSRGNEWGEGNWRQKKGPQAKRLLKGSQVKGTEGEIGTK
jgi:hypothetical protein